jgi:hypothetical protein
MSWALDPAPVISVRSKGETTLVAPTRSAAGESGLGLTGAMRFVHRSEGRTRGRMLTISIDVAISEDLGLSLAAESDRPIEFEPAKAIATNPTAMIKPTMAFALSQRSNSR